jgi:hypothetical protein
MLCKKFNALVVCVLTSVFIFGACFSATAADDFQKLHEQALNRPRRIIFNNDGNEPVYLCKEATTEELLKQRTTPLVGSHVDSIFYCTWSSGFGLFTHNTKVGQVFNTREAMFTNNLTQEFLDKGIDPLRVMADFGHKNNIEVFWSMRMNDTHDGAGAVYAPVMFRANKLKLEHPEYLIGSSAQRPKYGVWTAVDYGRPEIRSLALSYCEEVCQNYNVDGIELDFFRHALFFKCSGRGEACGVTELNQMTELIRQIRAMTEREGRKRKRPILVAIRVPDSVEYCKFIGLDLERWLSEHLVDLLIVGGYTQLNPWEYSVQLGHKYGVKVYPSIDESRVRDEAARKLRETPETFRGRARNVWNSGADGVYMFNFFDPHSSLWRELGDPKTLGKLDRNYFASTRGPGAMPVPHRDFIRIPIFNPADPVTITSDVAAEVTFYFGEDPRSLKKSKIELRLQCKKISDEGRVRFALNGRALPKPEISADWLHWRLDRQFFNRGNNALKIEMTRQGSPIAVTDLYVSVIQP